MNNAIMKFKQFDNHALSGDLPLTHKYQHEIFGYTIKIGRWRNEENFVQLSFKCVKIERICVGACPYCSD